jgi:hypothetical protein
MKEKTRIADLERQLQDAQFQLQVLKDKWSAKANGPNEATGMGQNSTTSDGGIDATVQADNTSSASPPTNTDQTRDRVIVSSVFLPAFWSHYTRDTDADTDAGTDAGCSHRYVHVVDSRELSKTQSARRPAPGDVRVVIIRDLRALRKDIWKIYEKKMVVAEADKRRGNAVIGLAEFVAAFLLGQYGTKVMVKRALVELAASLNAHRQVGLFVETGVRPVRLRPASSQRK